MKPHTPDATTAPAAGPSRVMQLSLWTPPTARWHARLVEGSGPVHEFDSPFELARFVARASPGLPAETGDPGGLR
jgi:hypothetical protein